MLLSDIQLELRAMRSTKFHRDAGRKAECSVDEQDRQVVCNVVLNFEQDDKLLFTIGDANSVLTHYTRFNPDRHSLGLKAPPKDPADEILDGKPAIGVDVLIQTRLANDNVHFDVVTRPQNKLFFQTFTFPGTQEKNLKPLGSVTIDRLVFHAGDADRKAAAEAKGVTPFEATALNVYITEDSADLIVEFPQATADTSDLSVF